jgi:hypothetical protein
LGTLVSDHAVPFHVWRTDRTVPRSGSKYRPAATQYDGDVHDTDRTAVNEPGHGSGSGIVCSVHALPSKCSENPFPKSSPSISL